MSEVIKKVDNLYYIFVGVQGENMARQIKMDVSDWMEQYPNATIYILFKPYNAQYATPVATTYEDGILTWTPSTADTSVPGTGYAEVRLMYATDSVVMKSRVLPAIVENSASGLDGAEVPSPFEEWTNQILAAAEEITDNIDTAEEAAATAVAAAESITGNHDVPITVNFGNVTSLPVTKSVQGITDTMTVDSWMISNPKAFKGQLGVTCGNGTITLEAVGGGIMSGQSSGVVVKVSTSIGGAITHGYSDIHLYTEKTDFSYRARDTFSLTNTNRKAVLNGFVGNGGKTIYFTVPVDKSMDDITSIAVTSLSGAIYCDGDAVDESTTSTVWTSSETYTVAASILSERLVGITIAKGTAFDAANHLPVVMHANLVLTFA